MTICLVSQEYPPESTDGGIGTQTWVKATGLVRAGHTVHVLSVGAEDAPPLATKESDGGRHRSPDAASLRGFPRV